MATVRKIFDLAAAILFTGYGEDVDYNTFSPALLEPLLVIALPYENASRRREGRETLKSAPAVAAIDDTEIDWDERITRFALPCGLASRLMGDEPWMKAEMAIEWNRFISALSDMERACETDAEGWG